MSNGYDYFRYSKQFEGGHNYRRIQALLKDMYPVDKNEREEAQQNEQGSGVSEDKKKPEKRAQKEKGKKVQPAGTERLMADSDEEKGGEESEKGYEGTDYFKQLRKTEVDIETNKKAFLEKIKKQPLAVASEETFKKINPDEKISEKNRNIIKNFLKDYGYSLDVDQTDAYKLAYGIVLLVNSKNTDVEEQAKGELRKLLSHLIKSGKLKRCKLTDDLVNNCFTQIKQFVEQPNDVKDNEPGNVKIGWDTPVLEQLFSWAKNNDDQISVLNRFIEKDRTLKKKKEILGYRLYIENLQALIGEAEELTEETEKKTKRDRKGKQKIGDEEDGDLEERTGEIPIRKNNDLDLQSVNEEIEKLEDSLEASNMQEAKEYKGNLETYEDKVKCIIASLTAEKTIEEIDDETRKGTENQNEQSIIPMFEEADPLDSENEKDKENYFRQLKLISKKLNTTINDADLSGQEKLERVKVLKKQKESMQRLYKLKQACQNPGKQAIRSIQTQEDKILQLYNKIHALEDSRPQLKKGTDKFICQQKKEILEIEIEKCESKEVIKNETTQSNEEKNITNGIGWRQYIVYLATVDYFLNKIKESESKLLESEEKLSTNKKKKSWFVEQSPTEKSETSQLETNLQAKKAAAEKDILVLKRRIENLMSWIIQDKLNKEWGSLIDLTEKGLFQKNTEKERLKKSNKNLRGNLAAICRKAFDFNSMKRLDFDDACYRVDILTWLIEAITGFGNLNLKELSRYVPGTPNSKKQAFGIALIAFAAFLFIWGVLAFATGGAIPVLTAIAGIGWLCMTLSLSSVSAGLGFGCFWRGRHKDVSKRLSELPDVIDEYKVDRKLVPAV